MEWKIYGKEKPPYSGYYLVVSDWCGVIEKAEYDGVSRWTYKFGTPTHWMPLPELPNP